jgi:hypothetical protein
MRNQFFAVVLCLGCHGTCSNDNHVGVGVLVHNLMAFGDAFGFIVKGLCSVQPATECFKAYVHR